MCTGSSSRSLSGLLSRMRRESKPDRLLACRKPKQERHFERLLVRDSVLPQAILAPAVAVVRANDHRVVREARQQRLERLVAPFDAGDLPASGFGRIIVRAERLRRVV